MPQKDFLNAQLEDACDRAIMFDSPVYMNFYEPSVQRVMEREIGRYPSCDIRFFGGNDFTERMMPAIYPRDMTVEDGSYPLEIIHLSNPDENITHRDVLGALIGLGIEREKIGDINVGRDIVQIFVCAPLGQFIEHELTQISHYSIKCRVVSPGDVIEFEPEYIVMDAIVPSMRLDAVVNTVFRISRNESAQLIKGGRVFINHVLAGKPSVNVKTGDLVSVRGKGRFIVDELGGTTKKGNLKLRIKKFA